MRLADLVTTSQHVARTSGRLEKIGLLAALLGRVAPAEVEIATAFLCGVLRQAKLGVGYASVHAALPEPGAESATLEDGRAHVLTPVTDGPRIPSSA